MATEKIVSVVPLPGFVELTASLRATALNDILSLEFETDFMVEDIAVTGALGYEVYLVYPSTLEFKLADTSSTWFLNTPSNQSKNWYNLPAKSKVLVLVDSYSLPQLVTLSVLGRRSS